MIKITKDTDIHQLLLDGYYIICSSYTDLEPNEICDEYWYLTDAPGSPSGKSIYCYTFYGEEGFDKWYEDYQQWIELNGVKLITTPRYACDINELQNFI